MTELSYKVSKTNKSIACLIIAKSFILKAFMTQKTLKEDVYLRVLRSSDIEDFQKKLLTLKPERNLILNS